MIARNLLVGSLTGAALLLGCSESAGPGPGPGAVVISIVAGDDQSGFAGTTLPVPLRVQVSQDSLPVAGTTIDWSTTNGSLAIPSSVSDEQGVATAVWTLGSSVGPASATASVSGESAARVTFRAQARSTAGRLVLSIVSGAGQTGIVQDPLPLPLRVKVTEDGAPKAGIAIGWSTTSGSFSISSSTTDANGVASARWILGPTPGSASATASVSGAVGTPVQFGATALSITSGTVSSGDNQSGVVGEPLPQPLVVRVLGSGVPEAGVAVTWTDSSGLLSPTQTVTDAAGLASLPFTMPTRSGPITVYAVIDRSKDPPVAFHLQARAGPSTAIVSNSWVAGRSIPQNFPAPIISARAVDRYGNPAARATIAWSVVSGPVGLVWSSTEQVDGSWLEASLRFTGGTGDAVVRATLAGTAVYTDFSFAVTPPEPLVILELEYPESFVSGINGSNPAVDTLPIGGKMTWLLPYQDLESHEIESVGSPTFIGGILGWGASTLTVTFTVPGTYRYQDKYWPGVVGTIVVQ